MDIEKGVVLQLAIQQLESEVASFYKGIEQEKKAIQEAPTARESWSDTTRSQKESLVGALQKQYRDAHKALTSLKQIKVEKKKEVNIGALIEIEEDEAISFYLIIAGTTAKIEMDDEIIVKLISAASPIARALSGHKTGDTIEVEVPAGTRTLKILKIQ